MRIWILLSILLLSKIVMSQEETTINPELPILNTAYKVYQDKLSIINIPVSISVKDIEKRINKEFGNVIYEDKSFEDNGADDLKVRVKKRKDIKVNTVDGVAKVEIPLTIWAAKRLQKSVFGQVLSYSNDTEFEITIHYTVSLKVKENWELESETKGTFKWDKKPYINVIGVEIPIESQVKGPLDNQVIEIARLIDKNIKETVNIKEIGRLAWQQMHEPIALDSIADAWLYIKPQSVAATQLILKDNKASLGLGITTYVQNTIGEPKEVFSLPPLPPLKIVEKIDDNFNVALSANAGYESIKTLLKGQFIGKTFEFEKDEQWVTVNDLDLWGSAERLVFKLDISGRFKKGIIKKNVKGILFLEGTPYFDTATQEIKIKDLEFNLETKDLLLKMAKWFSGKKIEKMMQESLVLSVEDQLNTAKKMIEKQLENYVINEYVTIKGTLIDLKPEGIFLTPESIKVIVLAEGNVMMTASGF